MNQEKFVILLFFVIWIACIIGLDAGDISAHDLWKAKGSLIPDVIAQTQFAPSSWWMGGLGIGLLIAAMPMTIGWLIDGKGQSAAGWLLMFSAIASLLLGALFLMIYLGATMLYFIGNVIFG